MSEVCERVVTFECEGETLLGIVSQPAGSPPVGKPAVLIVVGGPQYRAGAHRMFVQMARAVAAAGHVVMRFDVRGMGDGTGAQRDFERLTVDIGAAVVVLQQASDESAPIVLAGLCDGASAALLYLYDTADIAIGGLALLNPWARSHATLARTHVKHYYLRRVLSPNFWQKLRSGRVGARAARDFVLALWRGWAMSGREFSKVEIRRAPGDGQFVRAMRMGWMNFRRPSLLVLSTEDLTAAEFAGFVSNEAEWRTLFASPRVRRVEIDGADHTLSSSDHQRHFENTLISFVRALPVGAMASS